MRGTERSTPFMRSFRFVRAQRRFDSVEELIAQMRDDAAGVKFPSVV